MVLLFKSPVTTSLMTSHGPAVTYETADSEGDNMNNNNTTDTHREEEAFYDCPETPDHSHSPNPDHSHSPHPDHSHCPNPDHNHGPNPDHSHSPNPDHSHGPNPVHSHGPNSNLSPVAGQTDRLQTDRDSRLKQENERDGQTDSLQTDRPEQGDRFLKTDMLDHGDRLLEGLLQTDRLVETDSFQTDRLVETDSFQTDRLVETDSFQTDSDSELKEETGAELEPDDEYLMELEKELTEDEKETRRLQSQSLKDRGNAQFKAGDWQLAERSYKEALASCPVCFSKERSVLFSNRAAARMHQGLKELAVTDCSKAIELNPVYLRAVLRRAELYEQTDKLDESLDDYKKVLELDPANTTARQASMRLPQQIQERNEKLKEEMMGKLKDLGNLVLRPFGLSTNNFQVNQDAATGSYSINFVQKNNNNS